MIFGSHANLWSIGHNWARDNCHVAMLQTSSSKSKLLKAGGEFQVHNVLKSLYNGAHCVLLTLVSKIAFLAIQGGPNINLDLIFFTVGKKKPFKTHLKRGWLASFFFNKFNSFWLFLETSWQILKSLQSFFSFCLSSFFSYSDLLVHIKSLGENALKIKQCLSV